MVDKRKVVNWLQYANEIFQSAAGLKSVFDWLQSMKPVAGTAAEIFTPELHAQMKRRKQRNEDGPIDEEHFIAAKLALDGPIERRYRPYAENIDFFLEYLEYMDPDLRTIFVDYIGREVDDEQWRINYLTNLALITDEENNGQTIHANYLRFNRAFHDGILRKKENELKKFLDKHPAIMIALKDVPGKVSQASRRIYGATVNVVDDTLQVLDANMAAGTTIRETSRRQLENARRRAGR